MVIPRFPKLGVTLSRDASDFHQRNAFAQKWRKRNLLRLERIVRQLNAKRDAQALALGCVHRQGPNRIEVEAARTRLYVAPVAPNVKNVDEGQTRDFFYML